MSLFSLLFSHYFCYQIIEDIKNNQPSRSLLGNELPGYVVVLSILILHYILVMFFVYMKSEGILLLLKTMFNLQVVAVHIPEQEFDDFYNGCCNGTFWPLFHSMPDRAVFKAHTWEVSSICFHVSPQLLSVTLPTSANYLSEPISILDQIGRAHV